MKPFFPSFPAFFDPCEVRGVAAESGPEERWQHSGKLLELTDRAGVLLARACEESLLDVLVLRRIISGRMRQAALRLKGDFIEADLEAHLIGSYNPARVSASTFLTGRDRSAKQERAYQRWRRAIEAVDPCVVDILITVACHDIMPDARHELMLQVALAQLASYYKMPKTEGSDDNIDEAAAGKVRIRRRVYRIRAKRRACCLGRLH